MISVNIDHFRELLNEGKYSQILADIPINSDDEEFLYIQLTALFRLERVSEALELANNLEKNILSKSDLFKIKLYLRMGTLYNHIGDVEKGLIYTRKSYNMALELNNSKWINKTLNNLGYAYYLNGNLNLANTLLLQAFEGNQNPLQYNDNAITSHNLAILHFYKGDFDSSLSYCKLALESYTKINSIKDISSCLNQMGRICLERGEIEKATEFFNMCLNNYSSQDWEIELSNIFYDAKNSIELYLFQGERDKAKNYVNKIEEFANQSDSKSIKLSHLLTKAIYLKSGSRLKEKIEALSIFQFILKEDKLRFDFLITCLENIIEILLLELKLSENTGVKNEIAEYLDKLTSISKREGLFLYETECKILKAKIYEIDGNFDQSNEIYTNLLKDISQQNLPYLHKMVLRALQQFQESLSSMHGLLESNAKISERIELSRLEDYLRSAKSILDDF